MKTVSKENPVFTLHERHSSKVEQSKTSLFSRLNKIDPKIGKQIEYLYDVRKSKQPSPYLGELYPWVIQELFDLKSNNQIQEVSQDWLALYYYTIFTDDIIDSPDSHLDGKELISLTTLMKEGLFKLYKAVANTPYESQFEQVLNEVLRQGKAEEKLSGRIGNRTQKVSYTKKKNDLLKLCAMAILAKTNSSKQKSQRIMEFSDRLQLCFQYLDDISDLKEDYDDGNYTVPLNDLFEKLDVNSVDGNTLIQKLVETGTLFNFVKEIKSLLKAIVKSVPKDNTSVSKLYFDNLLVEIGLLEQKLLEINSDDYIPSSKVIDIEKRIQIVASST